MSGRLTRFLGDTAGRTLVKLLVISFVVGAVMSAFNWDPMDVVEAARRFVVELWNTGFAALGRFGNMIWLGAVIVVPVFLVLRILSYRR